MFLTFGSSSASLRAQLQLKEAVDLQSRLSESLSSGHRINRASDDAAGLAIAALLRADRAIYTQGLRNGNDAINAVRIFDGAIEQVSSIATRIQELAEQAANGTLSDSDRVGLDAEAQALRDEATRIISNTSFNEINLLDGSTTDFSIQIGNSSIDTQFQFTTTSTQTFTADGTFQPQVTFSVGRQPYDVDAADLNGDGNNDLIVGNRQDGEITLFLGNGDGSFQASTSIDTPNDLGYVRAIDIDGDGNIDLVESARSTQTVGVFLGNGDGTFGGRTSFDVGNVPESIEIADVNGDSVLDVINLNVNDQNVSVLIGNGDGTFQSQQVFDSNSFVSDVVVNDFDGDGNVDLALSVFGSNSIGLLYGNGDGTFQAEVTFSGIGSGPTAIAQADFDSDGNVDLVTANYNNDSVSILLGNGDGTFQADVIFTVGSTPEDVITTDVNGDGFIDLITADGGDDTFSVLLGNGDGTFQSRTTIAAGDRPFQLVVADFNGDGVGEIVSANQNDDSISFLVADSTSSGEAQTVNSLLIPEFSLLTQSGAASAVSTLDTAIEDLSSARGEFGSLESRLVFAVTNLQNQAENFRTAESRIRDLDVARAVAEYTVAGVRTQLATSVLAQVNRESALLLQLLTSS